MKIDDNLSNIFDIEPIGNIPQPSPALLDNSLLLAKEQLEAIEDDYITARNNLNAILEQGQDTLLSAIAVAKASEHPRAFEVVGGLMKHLSDINHQLIDLHKKKQGLDAPKNEAQKSANVTNNAIFVGSTSELSKMLEDLRKTK
jgi:hypothetical protein